MPKLKTHKGTAKRIRKSGSGKLMRGSGFDNHLLSGKSESRKRALRTRKVITGKIAKNLKRALGA